MVIWCSYIYNRILRSFLHSWLGPLWFFLRGQFLKKRKTFVQKVTSKKTLFETPYHPQDLRISQVRRESGSSAGTYPFHPPTIHPWAFILSSTSYKFQLYKIIPYFLAYTYHTFFVILYYINSFDFILYLSSSPFHTFEFIFLMSY